jgi:hypothetical protein
VGRGGSSAPRPRRCRPPQPPPTAGRSSPECVCTQGVRTQPPLPMRSALRTVWPPALPSTTQRCVVGTLCSRHYAPSMTPLQQFKCNYTSNTTTDQFLGITPLHKFNCNYTPTQLRINSWVKHTEAPPKAIFLWSTCRVFPASNDRRAHLRRCVAKLPPVQAVRADVDHSRAHSLASVSPASAAFPLDTDTPRCEIPPPWHICVWRIVRGGARAYRPDTAGHHSQ